MLKHHIMIFLSRKFDIPFLKKNFQDTLNFTSITNRSTDVVCLKISSALKTRVKERVKFHHYDTMSHSSAAQEISINNLNTLLNVHLTI